MGAPTLSARAALEKSLAEAIQHRAHYNDMAAEVKAMAAERETPQGREATMQAAMRYKAQALVWDREVCRLTAELQAVPNALSSISAERCAAVDETYGFVKVAA